MRFTEYQGLISRPPWAKIAADNKTYITKGLVRGEVLDDPSNMTRKTIGLFLHTWRKKEKDGHVGLRFLIDHSGTVSDEEEEAPKRGKGGRKAVKGKKGQRGRVAAKKPRPDTPTSGQEDSDRENQAVRDAGRTKANPPLDEQSDIAAPDSPAEVLDTSDARLAFLRVLPGQWKYPYAQLTYLLPQQVSAVIPNIP
jgi:hypothetical protein